MHGVPVTESWSGRKRMGAVEGLGVSRSVECRTEVQRRRGEETTGTDETSRAQTG